MQICFIYFLKVAIRPPVLQIGNYQISTLDAGAFALDGGAMFGVVPKSVWAKRITVDALNRIDMKLRCLLIQDGPRNILVDTGIGHKEDEKFNDMFRVDYTHSTLLGALSQHSLTPHDITDVILTHLHFDHAGGATVRHDNGKIVPTFPNAIYHVQQSNLDWARNPTERDRASYIPHNYEPLIVAGVLKTLSGPTELYPGIHLELCEGHTTGLQTVRITDNQTTLFYCADLVPTSVHLPLPWVMGYDLRPLITLEEKRRILAQAAQHHWILAFEHCPHLAAATISLNEKGYAIPTAVDL